MSDNKPLDQFLINNKDISINKLVYKRVSKELEFYIDSVDYIDLGKLISLEKDIVQDLSFLSKINFSINAKNTTEDIGSLLDSSFMSAVNIILKTKPSLRPSLLDSRKEFDKNKNEYLLWMGNKIAIEMLISNKVDKGLKDLYKRLFNIDVKFEFKMDETATGEEYNTQKQNEINSIITKLKQSNSESEKKPKTESKPQSKEGGFTSYRSKNKINKEVRPIKGLSEGDGDVCVEGKVFSIEERELKSGKILFSFSVTDYTSTIGVKIFADKKEPDILRELLVKNKHYKVQGNIRFDTFERELVIMSKHTLIKETKPVVRMDNALKKRVELHAHTKMSSLDGICDVRDLVTRANDWGHKAIAITDHGVVQSYPEAFHAQEKKDIKVIYGMEGYLFDDSANLIDRSRGQSLDSSFVVFDIETTGLSPKTERITEIGAIKVENCKIVDSFSSLVNPMKDIPPKIIELTGITNEMVMNQPVIEEVLPKFLDFIGDCPVVAHNAPFDTKFINEDAIRQGLKFDNTIVDTLTLSRILLTKIKRHKLNQVAKHLGVKLDNHHRAVDDAKATSEIFIKFIELLKEKEIFNLDEINTKLNSNLDYTKVDTNHVNILVQNYTGLRNLYELVTHSHIETFYKRPRLPKSLLDSKREGLLIGTACEAGELYRAIVNNKDKSHIDGLVKYYDFFEIQPIENNNFMLAKGLVESKEQLQEYNKKIYELGKANDKPVVATGDVHFLDPHDDILRKIMQAGQGYSDAENQPPIYFKTTEEMLKDFKYMGEEVAYEVVIKNTNDIADSIEDLLPIPLETAPPVIEGSDDDLRNMCYEKAIRIYGDPIPEIVKKRLDRELNSIISNGYAVMYIISQKLVTKSLRDGYLVGSRGSVGSSFVATMSDITEVNPLDPHYVCPDCKQSEFFTDGSYGSGADLPDKECPQCGANLIKDGHSIPFEVFLGFEGDKEPDIDLNFAGEYQSVAHKYTEELFGEGKVFRAGTIGTIAEKTAFGFSKKYFEEKGAISTNRDLLRLADSCTGIKRTTGQHPGGIMVIPDYKDVHEFTPIQFPANDKTSGVKTTHFDYHAISGRLLKLDILGHDVPTIIKMLEEYTGVKPENMPLDDPQTVGIFTSTDPLKIVDDTFDMDVGSLGIPEFGTKFVRQMLVDTQPSTFAELVRISGLSHGTDVWLNNGQDLVRSGTAELKDVISTRDDIMNYLILKGVPPKASFFIMEKVRKGKGLKDEDIALMEENNVPQWYIDSCNKIKYMFPKAHAVAYVMMSFRIAYFKVHYPLSFYATYFYTKIDDFDAELVSNGKESIKRKMREITELGNNATKKEQDLYTVLEVALEMYARGFKLLKVDRKKSEATRFNIIGEDALLPPFRALQGVGENAANNIIIAREQADFLSKEDMKVRSRISKTVIETLTNHGCISDLPDLNQLSLF